MNIILFLFFTNNVLRLKHLVYIIIYYKKNKNLNIFHVFLILYLFKRNKYTAFYFVGISKPQRKIPKINNCKAETRQNPVIRDYLF